jgi:hypothetical protein
VLVLHIGHVFAALNADVVWLHVPVNKPGRVDDAQWLQNLS